MKKSILGLLVLVLSSGCGKPEKGSDFEASINEWNANKEFIECNISNGMTKTISDEVWGNSCD